MTYITAFVAFVALFISFQQWKIARDKLKLDLYNRRMAAYLSVLDVFQAALMNEDKIVVISKGSLMLKFQREARFLFHPEDKISSLIKRILISCNEIIDLTMKLDDLDEFEGNSEEMASISQELAAKKKVASSEINQLESKLSPYLLFGDRPTRGIWAWWKKHILRQG